jgi:FAD:protein FMN transferase
MIGFVVWVGYLTVFGCGGEGVLFLRAANETQRERAGMDVAGWCIGGVVKTLLNPERFRLMESLFGVLGPTGRPVLARPGRSGSGCLFLGAPKWATGTITATRPFRAGLTPDAPLELRSRKTIAEKSIATTASSVLAVAHASGSLEERGSTRYEFTSTHMGTQWKIVLYSNTEANAKAAAKAAFARVAELEKVMSDYDGTSELMTLLKANDASPGTPQKLSDDLFDVLCKARKVTTETAGAFDPSIGPLVQLWRNSRRTRKLPDDETLSTAKKLVGPELWALDEKAKTLTLKHAKMRLDLGGIGKGYAADAAMAVLKKQGITSALIAASGDINVSAAPPGKTGWTVDIAPLKKGDEPRRLLLVDQSVSTSGDLFQYVEINGLRYSHVLDPATGLGMTGYRSGTAVMPSGWQADAYTKATLLMPQEKAQDLLEKHGGQMYLAVKLKPDDKPTVTQSKGFDKLLAKE